MKICAALAVALALLACGAVQAQYKCTNAADRVTFQQAPCPTGARSTKLDLPAPAPVSAADVEAAQERSAREIATADRAVAVRRAIDGRYPIVGMTPNELAQAMGQPRTVNTADYGRGFEEQRVYIDAFRTWYVYTRGGVVTTVQNIAGGDPRLAVQYYCPSAQQIRDEEVSLSSDTATDRNRRLEKLKETQRLCGNGNGQ